MGGAKDNSKKRMDFSNQYSEDEFKFIVSILHRRKIIEPIKKNSKKFRNEISGFRPDNLAKERVERVYLNHVYHNPDYTLTKYFESLLNSYIQSIEEQITNNIGPPSKVFEKIANNDMKCFRELSILLLEKTKFKKRLDMFFKIIDHPLTKEQIEFCQNDLAKIMDRRKLEREIGKKLSSDFEREKLELEKRFSEEVAKKKQKVSFLEQQINEIKKDRDNELLHKDEVIVHLKDKLAKGNEELVKEKDSYNEKLVQMEAQINELKAEIAQKNEQMNKLTDKLKMKQDQYNRGALKKWEENYQHLVRKLEDIRSSINAEYVSQEKIRNEVDQLLNKKVGLENKLAAIKTESEHYVADLKGILQIIGSQPDKDKDETGLLWVKSVKTKQTIDIINDQADFIDDLSENLRICGIGSNYVYNVARYTLATFASNLCLLLVGYNSREIADAISYVICGLSADIIGLPLGFNDSNKLIAVANTTASKVVVLENVVDTISESVYLPLVKQNSDKFLVFSMESTENFHLATSSLLHYMTILDLDTIIGDEDRSDDYLYAMVDQGIFNIIIEGADKDRNLRRINQFNDIIRLSNAAKLKLANVVSIMDRLGSPNAIYDVLNYSIKLLCQREDNMDGFNDFAKKYEHHAVT